MHFVHVFKLSSQIFVPDSKTPKRAQVRHNIRNFYFFLVNSNELGIRSHVPEICANLLEKVTFLENLTLSEKC